MTGEPGGNVHERTLKAPYLLGFRCVVDGPDTREFPVSRAVASLSAKIPQSTVQWCARDLNPPCIRTRNQGARGRAIPVGGASTIRLSRGAVVCAVSGGGGSPRRVFIRDFHVDLLASCEDTPTCLPSSHSSDIFPPACPRSLPRGLVLPLPCRPKPELPPFAFGSTETAPFPHLCLDRYHCCHHPHYPAGVGSAAIRCAIAPNRRRVRYPSASKSQS